MPKADQTPEDKRAAQIAEDLRKVDEQRRADAEKDPHGEKLDKLLSCMDGLSKRMGECEKKSNVREDAEMNHGSMEFGGKPGRMYAGALLTSSLMFNFSSCRAS